MTLRPHALALACLAFLAIPGRADDALSQTTISFYANDRPVGGFIFPIGSPVLPSAISNDTREGDKEARYAGNVQGRFTPPPGQPIVLFGEYMVVTTEAISAERAKAVQDLNAMWESDQQYRGRTLDRTELTADEWKLQTAVDVANLKRLIEIIDRFGWPGLRFAGGASQGAFLVLQHADSDTQRKYLPLLRDAVRRQDAMGSHLAMLEDRVRVADGKPQLYGTQLAGKPLAFAPIEDEAHVDERRRSVGLPPMAEYARMFGLSYPAK